MRNSLSSLNRYEAAASFEDQRRHRAPSFSMANFTWLAGPPVSVKEAASSASEERSAQWRFRKANERVMSHDDVCLTIQVKAQQFFEFRLDPCSGKRSKYHLCGDVFRNSLSLRARPVSRSGEREQVTSSGVTDPQRAKSGNIFRCSGYQDANNVHSLV